MIEYSEYGELTDILARSNHETTYEDLMKKEDKVLTTVNSVVKHYQEKKKEKSQFTQMNIIDILHNFFTEWSLIIADISKLNSGTLKWSVQLFTKSDRPIYIGLMLILIAVVATVITATS